MAKKGNSRQDLTMISLFIVLILVLLGTCSYFYWQNTENKKLIQNNNQLIDRVIGAISSQKGSEKPDISDPENSIIENTKVVSVTPSENKIVVLDKNKNNVPLVVTGNSKIQEVVSSSGKVEKWFDLNMNKILKDAKATVIHNKNREVLYMIVLVNK